jgi:hypothetical protein
MERQAREPRLTAPKELRIVEAEKPRLAAPEELLIAEESRLAGVCGKQ